jgi:hypothetical protein
MRPGGRACGGALSEQRLATLQESLALYRSALKHLLGDALAKTEPTDRAG